MKKFKATTTITEKKSFEFDESEVEAILIDHCLKLVPPEFKKAAVVFDIYGDDMLRSARVFFERTYEAEE